MDLTQSLKSLGFSLSDIDESDLSDFIYVEKVSHFKYVAQHHDFFGDWNEEILRQSFHDKRKMSFFKKVLLNGETVGFISYDKHDNKIDSVFIRLIEKVQGNGIGTWFLLNLKSMSDKLSIPVFLMAIRTNPAHKLYRHLGFNCYDENNVFFFFRYDPKQ